MAGRKGRSGRLRTTIYSKVRNISLSPQDSDLLPFFQQLDQLPYEQANAALLAAIRGGAAAAHQELERTESRKTETAIDALLNAFD